MALLSRKNGAEGLILRVKILDSSKTTGIGLASLANDTSGLIISTIADNEASATVYTSAASHVETISTLGTYAAPSASCCRFKEVDATNHKGLYEIQLANARYAVSGAKSIVVSVSGPANCAQTDLVIDLDNLPSNVIAISDDTTAADNCELMFDGTGYAGGTTKLGVNILQILGTTLTETAGQIAAGFKKFFDVGTPTGTLNSLPAAAPGASGGLPTSNGSKLNQTADLTAGQSIAVSDKSGFSLHADYNAAKTAASATDVTTALNTYDPPTRTELTSDKDAIIAALPSVPTTAQIKTAIEAAGSSLAQILADTGELQTDWVNGGRLDLLIDEIKAITDQFIFTITNKVDATASVSLDPEDLATALGAFGTTINNIYAMLAAAGQTVTVTAPSPDVENIEIIRGDAYTASTTPSRVLTWSAPVSTAGNLTSATVQFQYYVGDTLTTIACTIGSANTESQVVYCALSDTVTTALVNARYPYAIKNTTTKATIARGELEMVDPVVH